jgi:hypothetical protein
MEVAAAHLAEPIYDIEDDVAETFDTAVRFCRHNDCVLWCCFIRFSKSGEDALSATSWTPAVW